MSQHVPKSKENGVKSEKSPGKHACPPGPHAHPHPEAGDDSASDTGSDVPPVPENIQKRVNALKNIHMDVQRIEQEMYTKLFQLEAEQHKKMVALLQKRAEIVKGSYEPTEKESTFSLKDDEEKPEIAPATQDAGVPDFWLTIFQRASQTAMTLNEEDCKVLSYLTDVRCIYLEKPLGFKLEFEFKENPYFTNTILMRSYEFGQEVGAEDLYLSSGLAPKTTAGCDIQWKTGKDTSKKETATFQRNKRTGARREIKKVEEVESFFKFFKPSVTDLASLSNVEEDGDEKAMQALSDSAEQAEMDFELASYIRTRVIPRALLIFTGDDDDDMSYGGEEDYDEEDDEDDDDEGAGASDDDDSDESGDAAKKGSGPHGKAAKVTKGPARR